IYTVVYAAVLVVVVGFALALVYQALRPAQLENIANDTKKQILAAALIYPTADDPVGELYDSHIKQSYCVDSKGNIIDGAVALDIDMAAEVKKPATERVLPVFVCSTDKGEKYIVPVAGAGLWGPIWGYIAMDSNGKDIYGAYFGHQGETPGLGAEIERPAFSSQFEGKSIFGSNGEFESVLVVKKGQEPAGRAYVNAVSGGTITSQGVQKMLFSSLEPYTAFFKNLGKESNKE
ncbi:MAG: NADH:ubiquinone reductase (Na(+)-transporting) subunit C, partial [Muribaculaceae bacterium]|nr:NADH:ubiquinone reductase (Na(+)-transporting) subunit C [Muribaculaceae bacterium]